MVPAAGSPCVIDRHGHEVHRGDPVVLQVKTGINQVTRIRGEVSDLAFGASLFATVILHEGVVLPEAQQRQRFHPAGEVLGITVPGRLDARGAFHAALGETEDSAWMEVVQPPAHRDGERMR